MRAWKAAVKLGDIVTLHIGSKAGHPHVVVHEPINGRVQLCYCGSERWYVPEWIDVRSVNAEVPNGARLRKARRLLLAVKPNFDGWKRIDVGRDGQVRKIIVGHVDVPWSWAI